MICQREGCNRPVPPGRRKYCCVECSKIVNRRSAAERSRMRAEAYRQDRLVKFAPRKCLSCGTTFMSEGPWNRICTNCSEKNSIYSYNRSKGSSLSGNEPEEQQVVSKELTEDGPSFI